MHKPLAYTYLQFQECQIKMAVLHTCMTMMATISRLVAKQLINEA